MSVTEADLQAFTDFARKQLANGGADSVEQLAAHWREARELAADLEQAERDITAGRGQLLSEAIAEIRERLVKEQGCRQSKGVAE